MQAERIRASFRNASSFSSPFAHAISIPLFACTDHINRIFMNPDPNEARQGSRKRSGSQKYNKLTKEQKLELIRERAETHMSFSSIASNFSTLFGMKLSTRGVADIITFWRENGKLRGASNVLPAQDDIVRALDRIRDLCIQYSCSVTKSELKDFVKRIATCWRMTL